MDTINWLSTTKWWRVFCVQGKFKIKHWSRCTFLTKGITIFLNYNKDSWAKSFINSSVNFEIFFNSSVNSVESQRMRSVHGRGLNLMISNKFILILVTPAEGVTERTRSMLGINDELGVAEGKSWSLENRVVSWTEIVEEGAAEESVPRAYIRSFNTWSTPISERISSNNSPIWSWDPHYLLVRWEVR